MFGHLKSFWLFLHRHKRTIHNVALVVQNFSIQNEIICYEIPNFSTFMVPNMGILYDNTNSDVLPHSVDIHMNIPSNTILIIYLYLKYFVSILFTTQHRIRHLFCHFVGMVSSCVQNTYHCDIPLSVQVQHLSTQVSYLIHKTW